MNRSIALLLALLAPCAAVIGCSDGSSASVTPDTVPTSEVAPTTPPPAAPPAAPPPSVPADAGGESTRARCGASPYDWVESAALGDVLETKNLAPHTPIELNLAILQARNSNAFKTKRIARHATKSRVIRYQTQDRGALVDATAVVAYPDVASASTYPILLVLHGTTGFSDACAPSAGIGDDALAGFTDGTALLLSLLSSLGYVVVAPDYIGLKSMGAPSPALHPYLVAEPTAIASLDSVRATKKLLASSNVTPGDVVVVGGSQGGHAAAFVNRYLPHYAPELVVKGSVWDVPPTDVLGQSKLALAAWTSATDNVIAATIALESWYGASPNGLSGALNAPYTTTLPQAFATTCSPSIDVESLDVVFNASFTANGVKPAFGGYAPWACYMAENSLPTSSVPKLDAIPSMFLLGELDALVDNGVERASFQTLCGQGHVLSYLECAGATHTKPLLYAFDQWLDFLEDRLAGKALSGTCALRPAETCTSTP